MKSIAGLELLYPRVFQAKFREQLTCNIVSPVHRGWMMDIINKGDLCSDIPIMFATHDEAYLHINVSFIYITFPPTSLVLKLSTNWHTCGLGNSGQSGS